MVCRVWSVIVAMGLSSCCSKETLMAWGARSSLPNRASVDAIPSSDKTSGMSSRPLVEALESTHSNGSNSASELAPSAAELASPWAWFNRWRGDTYPLDSLERRVEPRSTPRCDPSALERYAGTTVRYAGGVLVEPAFVERLTRFEAIVNEVAIEVYGRPPSRLVHAGAYACRKSRNRATRLSEHALGNALDVVGFNFNPASKVQRSTTPPSIRGAFRVTVGQHWQAERTELGRLHRHFLRTLADRVVAEDVFRVALGPSHPGHSDHLHFDMSPWNYTHL